MRDTLSLISNAQDGDQDAANKLLKIIKAEHMPRVLAKYGNRNVLVQDQDIESEFLVGCWKAVGNAKMDVGNPLSFIVWKGQMAVASLFRKRIRKEVRYQCFNCGHEGGVAYRAKSSACQRCASHDVFTWMVSQSDTIENEDGDDIKVEIPVRDASHEWEVATMGIQIEEMRARLSGRALDLFDVIVLEGINRDSSTNYLKEIAERWGVSSAAVAATLRRLKRDILAYVKEGS